jgi:hypothetical protein
MEESQSEVSGEGRRILAHSIPKVGGLLPRLGYGYERSSLLGNTYPKALRSLSRRLYRLEAIGKVMSTE